jgi:hypothetical protein
MINGMLFSGASSSIAKRNGWIIKYSGGSVFDGTLVQIPSDSEHAYLITRNIEIRKIKLSTGIVVDNYQYSPTLSSLHEAVADSSSNMYITGSSGNSVYVLKINSSMQLVWQKTISNNNISFGEGAIRVDSSGNVYVTNYEKTTGSLMTILSKFDSNGNPLWHRQLGNGSSDVSIQPLALDSSSNVYVAGYFVSGSSAAAAVMKFDTNGNHQWTTSLDNSSVWDAFLNEVQVDSSGNVYALGFSDNGGRRSFIVKLNSSGSVQWQKTIGAGVGEWIGPGSMVMDGTTLYFNMFGPVVESNNVISIVALNLSGVKQFERQFRYYGQNLYSQKISIIGNHIYVPGYSPFGFAFKVPKDGSKTGTYNSFGNVVTYTNSATQLVEQNTTYSVSSGGISVSSTSRTVATASGSVVQQPGLTSAIVRRF